MAKRVKQAKKSVKTLEREAREQIETVREQIHSGSLLVGIVSGIGLVLFFQNYRRNLKLKAQRAQWLQIQRVRSRPQLQSIARSHTQLSTELFI